ncbi:MAG: C4-dicarboxylate ABC transporter permease [Paenibacillaceae bacterium ZCTH02-B3]|nr:MAG: C4-dicarboxylate ABC transporter permease [Paenibacillaceae bacterium ZCTH02-B3]
MDDAVLFIFGLLVLFLLTRTPIAVALGLTAFTYLYFFTTLPLTQVPALLFNALNSFPLVAIPLFILAANIMTQGGISERITGAANAVVGGIRGGLGATAVLSCMFFSAICGSSPATVIAIGTLLIPSMVRSGYSLTYATGLIATAGSLGILIPPSISMIIYGIATETSIGNLFIAGILPGLFAGSMLIVAAVVISRIRNLGRSGESVVSLTWKNRFLTILGALPSLSLPVIVLGGIYGGIFTPTEASAVAVIFALLISMLVHRQVNMKNLAGIVIQSARTSATVMFIVANGVLFSWVLTHERIPHRVAEFIINMDLDRWIFLLVVNILLLIVGCFVETSSAILVLAPILMPIAVSLGIDPIHLGIIMVMNLEIGMVTPPFGLNLFVASGITKMPVLQVAKASLPFMLVLLVCLFVVTYVPEIALFLINR